VRRGPVVTIPCSSFVPDDSCDTSPIGSHASTPPILAKPPLTAIGAFIGSGRTNTIPLTIPRRSETARGPYTKACSFGFFLRGVGHSVGSTAVRQSGVVTWVGQGIARVPERLPPSYHVAENSAPQVDVGLHILIILLETCPFA
jgi:hypothetical protein